ncbi:cytochrome-c oxidase, cbb3-type subunit III [Borborobacter arsenicus]|uniref:cytochrome-c oxidase, cbb3-type subunit III n=1 Tax=Borborobacter arsenicus TaxID=1851146 RepID=UPI001FE10CB1|nr:cytochrome-c oxidase, cbb3-type subunit III [Pseudaminobacter arsenicus]
MALEKRDPVTGRMTTGHEWNGIEELETPIPRVVIFFLVVTILFSIGYWIFMPAWPLGWTYTKGLLGIDQRTTVEQQVEQAKAERAVWMDQIEQMDFATIQADSALMGVVQEAGATLFGDNCAVCHGTRGTGGKGFPDLAAKAWLWGGDPEAIAETIRVGINSPHEETRTSQMLAFGRDGMLDRTQIDDVLAYVQSIGTASEQAQPTPEAAARGSEIFAENCASCHGEDAKGMHDLGAPDLTDASWIYGGDLQTLHTTVYSGRQGHMPAWEGRLSAADRKILTLYVLALPQEKQ